MKDDFFWVGSAGKCTSCGVLFIRITNCIVLYFCRISVTIVNIAISEWSALLESIPADHRLIHFYQLLHFAVVYGLVITVRFGSSLDQNPVLPAISLELPTPAKRRKAHEMLGKRVSGNQFFKIFCQRAFTEDRLCRPPFCGFQPSLVGKVCPIAHAPPQIDFTPYAYGVPLHHII